MGETPILFQELKENLDIPSLTIMFDYGYWLRLEVDGNQRHFCVSIFESRPGSRLAAGLPD